MNAILVSVDYTDVLRLTLTYNRRHFRRVVVVTSSRDFPNVLPIVQANQAEVFVTDAFYEDGAHFNKWKALEQGLDWMGRDGWLCLMDADVLWPKTLEWGLYTDNRCITLTENRRLSVWSPGHLIAPLRRMCPRIPERPEDIPPEGKWVSYPIHRNIGEWVGYSQIFHGSDPVLGPPPWHDIRWRHAGGADTFFQLKWPRKNKVRPPFECLHLGLATMNWAGRVTEYADGRLVNDSEAIPRRDYMSSVWKLRRETRGKGYDNATEKILSPRSEESDTTSPPQKLQ